MTTTIAHSRKNSGVSLNRRAFTLVEVLVTVSLCGLVLAISTGSLLFLAKTTKGLGNYQDMNMASRFTLEDFGSDARMTVDVNSATATRVSLDVYDSTGGISTVVYAFDAVTGTFSRTAGGKTDIILKDVKSLELVYYNLYGVKDSDGTINPIEVKEIQLQAEMQRNVLSINNTNEIISARFMMRNRSVSS
ncbi:prepilin-type N-terminal cleavage/methylation domain-containing protein [Pelagicoccus sp. SDUM812002]|uniref:prepilin-type N-terminal cleavage/methylation domain-containing protein n=1 Tax=Pelagicoccus sp. SDUM812002 TaxID=3041266 RepID=UPI0028100B70|nr:prepilin-type N-terminal cleavage/methylation domain-containing protein [Pelagicoccus sp. SDUM812002]MDQ8186109.1 prepilin-type N-terminal cleavage/methylation domain-containing protein [Pelagicoccus sp. SDUM812002]